VPGLVDLSIPSVHRHRQTVAEQCAGVIFVAVDIGGTFTDLIGFDDPAGRFIQAKEPDHAGQFHHLFTQNFDPTKLLGLSRCWPSWRSCSTRFVRRAEVHFGRRRAE
jgi:hypothetical protein